MKITTSNRTADVMSLGVNVSSQPSKVNQQKDFKSFMSQADEAESVSKTDYTAKTDKVQKDSVDDTEALRESDVAREAEKTSDVDKVSDKDMNQKVDETETADVVDESQDLEEISDMELISEDDLTAVMELLNNIQNTLQQMLGMNDEEFQNLLKQQNMELSDLLIPEQRQQFLLAANQATPLDLLTNENLANLLQQANATVENMIDESGIASDLLQTISEEGIANVEAAVVELTSNNLSDDMNLAGMGDNQNVNTGDSNANETSQVQVTVESDVQNQTSDQNSTSSEHSAREQSFSDVNTKVVNQLTQNVAQAINQVEGNGEVTAPEIVRQVVEEIKLVARNDVKSIELQLYPEHLGKVTIEVSTRNGAVTAQITAENEMARAALEGGLQSLREAFATQEIKVEAIEVMVATPDFSQNDFLNKEANQNQDDKSSNSRRPINLEEFLEEEEVLTEEEQIQVEMMKAEGRNVDYTA